MSDRYPLAKWQPAASSAFRKGTPDRAVDLIVCHITSGHAAAEGTASMFATAGCRTSAHFVIGQDGTILQCVGLDDVAQHAHDANGHSVGIEHCAREPREFGPTDAGMALTDPQIAASVALVEWLCDRYGLPLDRAHVKGHAEADPKTTHAGCPEAVYLGWPWERWIAPAC